MQGWNSDVIYMRVGDVVLIFSEVMSMKENLQTKENFHTTGVSPQGILLQQRG